VTFYGVSDVVIIDFFCLSFILWFFWLLTCHTLIRCSISCVTGGEVQVYAECAWLATCQVQRGDRYDRCRRWRVGTPADWRDVTLPLDSSTDDCVRFVTVIIVADLCSQTMMIFWFLHCWICVLQHRQTTSFSYCPITVFLFGHIARMPHKTDARKVLTASPLEKWRRPPGRPCSTWMKTIQQELKFNNLSFNEAIDMAQNHPLWRLIYVWRYKEWSSDQCICGICVVYC